jgi:DNA polymerase I-like protein with 3'-5' exonuclease and polymerase domains
VKKAVFVLGTMSRYANRGDALSAEDTRVLSSVADKAGLDADVVFATHDIKAAKTGNVSMKQLREERDRMLEEIADHQPDLVITFGPTALKSVFNKGNAVLSEHLRQQHEVEDIGAPVYCTHSLDHVAAKPGMAKWLVLDARAAVEGFVDTRWGDYVVLQPADPAWDRCPDCFKPGAVGDLVGFDLETYPGLDPWAPDARIRMAIISNGPHRAHVVQLGPDSRLPMWLQDIVEDPAIVKAGSNIKFDYKWLRRFGVVMQNMHDTSVAEHILDETNPMKDLKSLTFLYAPWLGDYSKGHRALVTERGGWEFVEDDEQYDYAGADGEASYMAAATQLEKLRSKGLLRAYHLAHDLYVVLCEMEFNGCRVDMEVNEDLDRRFLQHMTTLRQEIMEALGPINPGSPSQLAEALVEHVKGIDLGKRKLGRLFQERPGDDDDEEISTDRATLEREASKHPIIETVLRWRRLSKLHGTYVTGVRDKYRTKRGDRDYLSTTFRGDVVETNRLSSQGPNLQNQPTKPDPDDPHPIPLELNTKRQFISRFPGGQFMEADLAQAEIRVAAMLSGDPGMLAAIDSGEDIHTAMASTLLGKPMDEVTKLERHQCKRLTFLILYGGGANTLSKQLGIHKEDAKELIAQYFRTFTQLNRYIKDTHVKVKRDLYVESIFGYRRRFKRPPNWNTWDGWRIERQSWNFLVQNTAACLLYCALIKLRRLMQERNMKSLLVLTVHDSIGIDCHPDEVDEMAALVKHCMENPDTYLYGVDLTVPMGADVEVGPSWGDKQAYQGIGGNSNGTEPTDVQAEHQG